MDVGWLVGSLERLENQREAKRNNTQLRSCHKITPSPAPVGTSEPLSLNTYFGPVYITDPTADASRNLTVLWYKNLNTWKNGLA